jgi:hypothetical protein
MVGPRRHDLARLVSEGTWRKYDSSCTRLLALPRGRVIHLMPARALERKLILPPPSLRVAQEALEHQ